MSKLLQGLAVALLCTWSANAGLVIVRDNSINAGDNVTWTNDNMYILDGPVFVESTAVLTIEPGVVIKGKQELDATEGTALIVCRGAKIYAEGTDKEPIIFTAFRDDPKNHAEEWEVEENKENYLDRGLWGGVIILGNAPINNVGGEYNIEGLPEEETRGRYGGNDEDDTSGVLRYVSIRFGGFQFGTVGNNEINGLTLGGVGRGTVIEFVEVWCNLDDGFEFFGGTVNTRYLAAIGCGDDAFDWDDGFRGRGQYWYGQHLGGKDGGDYLGEFDGGASMQEPLTIPVVSNGTFIGNGARKLMLFREGTGGKFYNCYFANQEHGIDLDNTVEQRVSAGDLCIKNSVFWAIGLEGASRNKFWYPENPQNGIIAERKYFADSVQYIWNNIVADVPLVVKPSDVSFQPGWERVRTFGKGEELIVEVAPGIDWRATEFGDMVSKEFTFAEHVEADGTGFLEETTFKGAFTPFKPLWLRHWSALDNYGFLDSTYIDSGAIRTLEIAHTSSTERNSQISLRMIGNSQRIVQFNLSDAGPVSINLYAANGKRISIMQERNFTVGKHEISLTDAHLRSGVYVCELRSQSGVFRSKMMVY